MNKGQTGFVCSDRYLTHDPGQENPECPERLRAVTKAVEESHLMEELVVIEPAPAELKWIECIHTGAHINNVREACENAPVALDWDTTVSRESFDVACLAAGGVLQAVDAVVEGKARNAFCAVRPPGHHATLDRAMGFCLFNNVAVAARYIQDRHGLKRVLIVDWDAHHGNGTQDLFYDDPSVFYFSVHQFPGYPGSGAASEKGGGKGIGFNINVPMRLGSGDAEYLRAFKGILQPAADKFRPDFVLISAGFDAHEGDPITKLNVTTEGFAWMTDMVKGIADKHCEGRLVSVLEGGYDLKNLGDSVVAHVKELME
jgi:acetoin utilization deacetylase AcuC-like enzyme